MSARRNGARCAPAQNFRDFRLPGRSGATCTGRASCLAVPDCGRGPKCPENRGGLCGAMSGEISRCCSAESPVRIASFRIGIGG
jgi:hypothetical protein